MEPRVPQPNHGEGVSDDGGVDLVAALKRLGGDKQLLRDMAQIFVEDAPGLLEQAGQADSSEAAWRAAHSLKGLASNFSEPAANAAQAAEIALRNGDTSQIEPALAAMRASVDRLSAELQRSVLR